MMIAAGMGYPRGLLQLLLVLTFTAVGTQAHCGSDEIDEMRPCVSPHMRKLAPLINAFCNHYLITQDLCNVFKQIKDCASRKDIAECVEYNVFEELSQSGKGYSCGLMDFQDKCGNATMIKKKTATIRKARASKETEDETEDHEETADETENTEETATGRKAIPSKETANARKAKPSKETATGRNAKPSNETATGRNAKPSKETATGRNAKPSKETATGRNAKPSKETATGRNAKPSKETADETEDSEETADETEDSEETATGRKAKPSKETATGRKAKPSKGAASTPRASLVPVFVFTICLLLMSM
ncbi:balbiani ring protein 2-like isoform X42 [Pomacea canaliculata]|uniref:balbiani ring protein 2-like isoform X41 n=1 Tax=Pomacea canaliculata TaxID=400727 RepID=UPI000D72A195|nr:balbiani ring protein 2-like isoform X41 [Pomacea canaliculata]XP_025100958.1 balbiani ring protein 2-like isoform X42 [Pomacea canaliculata]